jgi:hypothetical protein
LHRSMAVPLSSSKSSKFLREFYFIILNNLWGIAYWYYAYWIPILLDYKGIKS